MTKLTKILKDLEQGKISADNAEVQILDLFGAMLSLPIYQKINIMKTKVKSKPKTKTLNKPVITDSFPIKNTYTKEEVKKIALAFTKAATPSKFMVGIENRFEQVWQLNFGS